MPPSQSCAPGVVTIAAWQEFAWLLAGFSTRQSGCSTVYSSGGIGEQNLGWMPEDDAEIVAENRRQFIRSIAGSTKAQPLPELVTTQQFHGVVVTLVEQSLTPLSTADGRAVLRGDGLMTREPGLLLGIQTADCVPVLVADTRTRTVAAFHAGWRGTLERIVERGVGAMRTSLGSQPEDLIAAIGPSIAACCFEVGAEVRDQFQSQFAYTSELFSEVFDADFPQEEHTNAQPRLHLDLWEANRRQLLDADVSAEAISIVGECTACTRIENGERKYFSHRAEHGRTGRMLSVVGITAGR